uniref:deubiquitinating protein VCPIP1 isoform X2 n=1 Tax=Myxine glutinosa TaxID=7769 RepID=UPI00358E74BB
MQPAGRKGRDRRTVGRTCPDESCQAPLVLPATGGDVQCSACGQRFSQGRVGEMGEEVTLHNLLRNFLLTGTTSSAAKPAIAPAQRIMGLTNLQCKLLSPILTCYGMDKATGKARPLRDMKQGEMFDCAVLADRAFQIDIAHLDVEGYGRDRSGSVTYLKETLKLIQNANEDEDRLIPIHAEMDGHCLVHAVSRALVGWELFWHSLRENLKVHFKTNLQRYAVLFRDFVDASEWKDIVSECDPAFVPPEGSPLGLRNIHIFGLANVLHRPIFLLDSWQGMQSSADYSATFLPGLVDDRLCRNRDGRLNPPLCLAWSSADRNHYIPLVGVRGRPAPCLPGFIVPKPWGVPHSLLHTYVQFDDRGFCTIGGERELQQSYIRRLVASMEEVYVAQHGLPSSLVSDARRYIYRWPSVRDEMDVVAPTRNALQEARLFRCLSCQALLEFAVPDDWLSPGGKLREMARRVHGTLRSDKSYSFPHYGLVCSYDVDADCLSVDHIRSELPRCAWCQSGTVRRVSSDGSVCYRNGDRTITHSTEGKCGCGFKHYWEGREYDNLPEALPVTLEWNGRVVRELVYWFQHEANPALNSNAYAEATRLVAQHFPGEFGSEVLVQKVVNTILHQTASRNPDEYRPITLSEDGEQAEATDRQGAVCSPRRISASKLENMPPSKIILTGPKTKTLHKEELTMSETERDVQQRITQNAVVQQRKSSAERIARLQNDVASTGHQSTATMPANPPRPVLIADGSRKVRVVTADGRQSTLTLAPDTTFAQFRDSIENALGIPPELQRLRHGFPPQELLPPAQNDEGQPLPLEHGERIIVEVLGGTAGMGTTARSDPGSGREVQHRESDGVTSPVRTSRMLQPSEVAQEDSVDLELSSLQLLLTLTGQDMWSYVKKLPYLFVPGGVFYMRVKKEFGLADGQHTTLPELPGRTLVYNGNTDSLELCLEPDGHHVIGPNLDHDPMLARALESRADFDQGSLPGLIRSRSREGSPSHSTRSASPLTTSGFRLGSGGAVVRRSDQQHTIPAFHGKGHSLGHGRGTAPEARLARPQPLGSSDPAFKSVTDSQNGGMDSMMRVGPGFSTARRPTGSTGKPSHSDLAPEAIETQRRRLMEMLSSIHAAMEGVEPGSRGAAAGEATGETSRIFPHQQVHAKEETRPPWISQEMRMERDSDAEDAEEMESQDDDIAQKEGGS